MLPPNFRPMLATITEPFDSIDYTYEIKWDGYRCLAYIDSNTRLQSRHQKELTNFFPELAKLHQRIKQPGCLLDGEIIALRNGKPNFLELQKRAQLKNFAKLDTLVKTIPVVYVAFDLLYYNQKPIFHEPIETRRTLLEEICESETGVILGSFVDQFGIAYFNAISELKLEGVIAKKKSSPYLPGLRTKNWLKFKRRQIKNFIICGYILKPSSRGDLSSLIIGAFHAGELRNFGMVGSGFTQNELKMIQAELFKLKTEICPFTDSPLDVKNTFWVSPLVVCEVEYFELTDQGNLRHPVFKRFQPDKKPEDCQFED